MIWAMNSSIGETSVLREKDAAGVMDTGARGI